MALSVGNNNVAGMSVGTDEVASAYWGNSEVWSSAPAANMCTVANLGAQDPSTVTFTDTGSINYDFEEVTVNGNVFIKIPTFYRKVETVVDNQITSFTLSDAKVDNNYHPYSCFLKPNGDLMDYVLIGKYTFSSTSEATSVDATQATITVSSARSLANALGSGYQLYDWQLHKLFVDLSLCKSKQVNFNSGTIITEYLKIERLNSGVRVDGIGWENGKIYIAYDTTKYTNSPTSSTNGYVSLNYDFVDSNGFAIKLGYDTDNPFSNFATISGGSSSTYYCDYNHHSSSGNQPLEVAIGGSNANCGLWYSGFNDAWTLARACRLCYRPL